MRTALGRLQYEEYGAVVVTEPSDGDGRAQKGYVPVGGLRSGGEETVTLFVYLSSDREDQRLEAINRGAYDATSRPNALFDMVMRSLV